MMVEAKLRLFQTAMTACYLTVSRFVNSIQKKKQTQELPTDFRGPCYDIQSNT